MDKGKLEQVLETVREGLAGDLKAMHGGGAGCCCPFIVIYLIETQCLNINNAGCTGQQFCGGPGLRD